MKIAIVTDDGRTISAHFGRAAYYAILTIENGQITARKMVEKPAHHHHHNEPHDKGGHHSHDHHAMLDPIADCQVAIARGMGQRMYDALQARGIHPILTEVHDIEAAAAAYINGTLANRPERLH